jgi:hypothetical protein
MNPGNYRFINLVKGDLAPQKNFMLLVSKLSSERSFYGENS